MSEKTFTPEQVAAKLKEVREVYEQRHAKDAEIALLRARAEKAEAERDGLDAKYEEGQREICAMQVRLQRVVDGSKALQAERDGAIAEVKQLTDACFEYSSQIGKLRRTLEAISNDDYCPYKHNAMAREVLKELGPLPDYSKYEGLSK